MALSKAAPSNPEFAGDAFLRGAIQTLGSNKDVFVPLNGDSMGIRRADGPNGKRILAAVFPSHRNIADFSATIANEKANYDEVEIRIAFSSGTLTEPCWR